MPGAPHHHVVPALPLLSIALAAVMLIAAMSGCSSNPAGPSDDVVYDLYTVDVDGQGQFTTIQEGLNAASDGDTVLVMPGTYVGPSNTELDFAGKGVVLMGAAERADVVIDCRGDGRAIYLKGGNAPVIENITITNGSALQGGGMYCEDVSPSLRNVRFLANYSEDEGGGLYCKNASPALSDVLFDDNVASTSGGGMMCVSGSSAALSEVTFFRNAAQGSGGALGCIFSSPALSECVFRRNSAFFGGGVYCGSASPAVTSCTFVENEGAYGGGIYVFGTSSPSITHTIVAFSTSGEGLLCNGSTPFTTLSCVYGNAGGDQLCGDYSTSMLYEDPLFCGLAAGELSLQGESPCLPDNNPWGVRIGAFGQGCE